MRKYGNGRPLNEKEQSIIDELKKRGILCSLEELDVKEMIGGVSRDAIGILCSDDYTDMTSVLRENVAAYFHPVRFFGGPLLLAPSYRGFKITTRDDILENIMAGMDHIQTDLFISKFHVPCGMGDKNGHSVMAILAMVIEVADYLTSLDYFKEKRVCTMFHTKKISETGKMIQNSYFLEVDLLREYLSEV